MSWAGSGGTSRAGEAFFFREVFTRGRAGALVSRFARGTARARGAVAVESASDMDATPFRGGGDSTTRPRRSADAVEPIGPPLRHLFDAPQGAVVETFDLALVRADHREVDAVFLQERARVGVALVHLLHVLLARPRVETLRPDVPGIAVEGPAPGEVDLRVVRGRVQDHRPGRCLLADVEGEGIGLG